MGAQGTSNTTSLRALRRQHGREVTKVSPRQAGRGGGLRVRTQQAQGLAGEAQVRPALSSRTEPQRRAPERRRRRSEDTEDTAEMVPSSLFTSAQPGLEYAVSHSVHRLNSLSK